MGYQFIHIESYARVAGKGKEGGNDLSSVAGEADRLSGNCDHVTNPQPPKILYGVSATKVAKMAAEWAENSKDSTGKRLRKDGLCLVAGVISAPDDMSDKDWQALKKASYKWLKEKHGDRLKSIIEHTDEPFRHIHFYVIPRPGERFEDIHQGKKAAAEVKKIVVKTDDKDDPEYKKNKKGAQNDAYKAAMEAFQTEFYHQVAMKNGLTRLGPGRRRLTRKAWNEEQRQANFLRDAQRQHEAARKKGYKAGYAAGQQELETIGERAGTVLAAAGRAVFSVWHKPSREADLQREKAEKKAQEEADKRRSVEATLRAQLERQAKLHQEEVDRLQRIAQNAETDLHRLETKLADLTAADPNARLPKKKGLDI